MRILLATAVAIAPLMAASGAMAEVVISAARTTPINTSNATGSAADTIRIASGGAINVTSGAAITLDSNHSVDIDSGGSVGMTNAADGAIGILANGGNTGNVVVGGAINISDSITADTDLDADNDGDLDGQFSTGTGRYGLRVAGAAPLTGNVVIETTGSIALKGNQSYGVSVEAPVTGNLDLLGTINVIGDQSGGVRTTGDVGGDIRLAGSITGRGAAAEGVSINGNVAGQVLVYSNITATGYRYTTPPTTRPDGFVETNDNDDDILLLDELDADDLLQGGPALRIAGNVGEGVLIGTALVYTGGIEGDADGDGVKNGDEDDDGDGTVNRSDTDRDGNGILDTSQRAPTITSFGAAPAVVVGSSARAVSLAAVGTGDQAYGFINQGVISGNGVYEGVASNGLQIGGTGQAVTVAGGLRNLNTISAVANTGNATALRIGAGASVPTLVNAGNITAGVTSKTTAVNATALLIEAGSTVNSLTNSGTILANSAGGVSNPTAVRDLSGSLTTITNTNAIRTVNTAADNGTPSTGVATAIDVSANTTGVSITQMGVVDADETNATNPDTDGDGVEDADEPVIFGAVRLGSGADTVNIGNGLLQGDIAFGAGADSLTVNGGARVQGALSDSDGALSINVANGVLDARQTAPLTVSSLNVGAQGDLIISLDPASTTTGGFNVTGAATLADGAGLGVRFTSLIENPGRYTLIDANSLTVGAIDPGSLQENSPYLYVVTAGVDQAQAQVFADVRRRTADEADLIAVETAAFDSFYGAIGDPDATAVRNAFLAQTDREGFINLYEQLLPDHSGGPLLSLASGVDAVTRALTGRNAVAAPGETSAWVQEINFYADKDKTDTYGFRSEGFGVAGGIERGTGLGAVGLSVAFTSSDLEDPEAEAEEVLSASLLELGLYWRAQGQYWTTWARGAAGYATFNSERRLVGEGVNLANESDWNGLTLTAAGGASYERNFGRFNVRPEAYVEYFSLSEDGHVEEGGGDGFDLEIDDREGHMFSATAAINVGMGMGENNWLRPEVRVGWRQNISVDPGETIARFRSGGGDFTLSPDSIEGGGPIVGFRLNIGNDLGQLSINADAEMIEDYIRYMLFLRASFRF